jgi:pimeloyl-ACP methyl ester carboxylesterase
MPPETLTIGLRNGSYQAEVLRAGQGDPLIYLHGAVGHKGWAPFLDRLAEHFTVYAPYIPGYSQSTGLDLLDDVLDLTLHHFELMDALGLSSAHVVGHFLGGMIAAEMSAVAPGYVKNLVLASPAGLWRDDAPVVDFLAMNPAELQECLWATSGDGSSDDDAESAERAQALLLPERVQDLTAAGKFLWPIPDRGLKRRAYRIKAPSLIIWGGEDRINPPVYAEDFSRLIVGSRVQVLAKAGHLPMLEQPDAFSEAILGFLNG